MKNLTFKLQLSTALIFALSVSACRKDGSPLPVEATVLNTGAVAADGCGWLLKIGDDDYSPTNLEEKYKENNLKVMVSYNKLSSKFECGWGRKVPEIKITNIRKK